MATYEKYPYPQLYPREDSAAYRDEANPFHYVGEVESPGQKGKL